MRTAVLLAALALAGAAIASSASASSARAPSSAAATAAFGSLLHQLYGAIHGYWTCPPPAFNGRVDCLAEVHAGHQWHRVAMSARRRHGVISFMTLTNDAARTWRRHWSPFSRHYILRSNEPQVPGVLSVNGPAYDWGWLALGAQGVEEGQTRSADALDGNSGGLTRFYIFICSRRGGLITCQNALGDAMRYRPGGTAAATKASVVLGKTHLLSYGIGWGTSHPRLIFNGGDPSGKAWHLTWHDWGAASAYARGSTWIFRPKGGYYTKPGAIELRASRIGRCTPHGPRAYTYLQARSAVRPGGHLTHWYAWGGWKSICIGPP